MELSPKEEAQRLMFEGTGCDTGPTRRKIPFLHRAGTLALAARNGKPGALLEFHEYLCSEQDKFACRSLYVDEYHSFLDIIAELMHVKVTHQHLQKKELLALIKTLASC